MNPFADPARRLRRPLALLRAPALAGLVSLSLVATACGSPGTHLAQLGPTTTTQRGTSPTSTGKYAAWLAYSHCMRSHGVPNYPDPVQVGGKIQITGSQSGMNPNSPVFKSAQQSCGHLLPSGGQSTQAAQQQELARMLQVSQCMRAHGISGFPDPALSPPSNRAGHSAIMSNDGVWLAIPNSIDVHSPMFEHAATACNLG
ncbi:MAG: hypothetical protein WB770_11365 [Acidimicrobiales bacterium]